MLVKDSILNNLFNSIGWKTDRKIIVFESDDWGAIRMDSAEAYKYFLKKGYPVDKCIYNSNDILEGDDDLETLFEVLYKYRDKNNHPAVFTANALTANPDFEKIAENEYSQYYYESISDTHKRYSGHGRVADLYQSGITERIFKPQFHGREHVNIARWMSDLRKGEKAVSEAFVFRMYSVAYPSDKPYKAQYMDAFGTNEYDQLVDFDPIIASGIELFQSIFKYWPKSFIAPCYKYHPALNNVLLRYGVKYMQGARTQIVPIEDSDLGFKRVYHYTGEKNGGRQLHLVRNVFFEVAEHPEKDWVSSSLKEISNAFFWKTPAIISTHRVNYVGGIHIKNRDHGLLKLSQLLTKILKKWPDVEFMTSDQLGQLIDKRCNDEYDNQVDR